MNGLVAADQAIVPVNMQDRAALNGVEQLLETLLTIQQQTPKDAVRLRAIVRNRVTEGAIAFRRNASKLDALAQQGVPVARTMLKEARAWHNAGAEDLPVVMYAPNSDSARNVRELMVELWGDVEFPYMRRGGPVEILAPRGGLSMALRKPDEVGVPDMRRFSGLQTTDTETPPDKRASRAARAPRRSTALAPVVTEAPATRPPQSAAPRTAESRAGVEDRPLLADERQLYLQSDVPELAMQRVKLVSFELADEREHLRRHQTILGALVWAYVDHTDQGKLDELADLLDAYRGGPWHGLPEVRRLSARVPASLKRRVQGTVLALSATGRDATTRVLIAALVWRHVVSSDEDAGGFARLVGVVGAYHQEMERRSLTAPQATPAHTA